MKDDELPPDEQILTRLSAEAEPTRYQMLNTILESKKTPSSRVIDAIHALETDPSRPVRQLARDLHLKFRPEAINPIALEATLPASERYPGSLLLTLCSWGSAVTGLLAVGMSLANYYLLGRFPFPDPVPVLMAVLVVLVFPYLVLGTFLLLPGKIQKQLALGYAYFSMALSLGIIIGALQLFESQWAVQFTRADATAFRNFLSPYQLTAAFMPLLAGQAMLLYFLGNSLGPTGKVSSTRPATQTTPSETAQKPVDAPSPED